MHDPVMNFAEQDKCKRPGDAEARVENGQNAGLPPYEDVLARIWAFALRLSNDEGEAAFNFFPDGPSRLYAGFYKKNEVDYPSGGGITMTQIGKKGEYCAGSFVLSPSGFISTENGKQLSTAVIEGRFKLKRY